MTEKLLYSLLGTVREGKGFSPDGCSTNGEAKQISDGRALTGKVQNIPDTM
jgi:hypothetical protein